METPLYHIRFSPEGEVFDVAHSRAEGAACPETHGRLSYDPAAGFRWVMWCFEAQPQARFSAPNAPVHKDSCMELFVDFFPAAPERRYVNLEFNSLGAVHASFGASRHDRVNLSELGAAHPAARITRALRDGRPYWQGEGLLPRETLETLYTRPCVFAPGDILRGNFYKCGDETRAPHWGSWAKVERLDFHTPEFFGILALG